MLNKSVKTKIKQITKIISRAIVVVSLLVITSPISNISADTGSVKTCRGTQYGVTCVTEKTAFSQSEILIISVLVFVLAIGLLTVYKYFKANLVNQATVN